MLLAIISLLTALLLFYNFYYKRRNLPPGPTPLPLLGNLLEVKRREPGEECYLDWCRKYGPVFTYWLGELPVVCVADYKTIIEGFQKDADAYVGRFNPVEYDKLFRGGEYGVIQSENELWRDQRRFAIHVFRDFGVGKNLMQDRILIEMGVLFERIDSLLAGKFISAKNGSLLANNLIEGKELNIGHLIDVAVGSIINNLMFGYRFDGDKLGEFFELKSIIGGYLVQVSSVSGSLVMWKPSTFSRLPYFAGVFAEMMETRRKLFGFFEEKIREHGEGLTISESDLDSDAPATDYVGAFLREKARKEANGDAQAQFYSIDQLKNMCFDLWLAGQESTSTTLAWGIAYLLHNPDALEKLYRELDDVIGSDRLVTVADRPNLHYANAVINETQRVANLLALNVPHRTTRDVTLNGHWIAKGTCIVPQISAVLIDDKIFPNPKQFIPERFLDDNGHLKRCEELIPFSVGKRQCLGESLAKMELFLFMTNIFNRYKVSPGQMLPSLKRTLRGTIQCPPFTCQIQKRQ